MSLLDLHRNCPQNRLTWQQSVDNIIRSIVLNRVGLKQQRYFKSERLAIDFFHDQGEHRMRKENKVESLLSGCF